MAAYDRTRRGRSARGVREGRWVADPAVLGSPSPAGARGVWRFALGDGSHGPRTVLVDERSGAVLARHRRPPVGPDGSSATPRMCRGAESACTSGFARIEDGAPRGSPTSTWPTTTAARSPSSTPQVAGVDLTHCSASTWVGRRARRRRCASAAAGEDCPFANAFWNGPRCSTARGTPAPTTSSATR